MSAEALFQLAFPLAVPFWVLMIVLPKWRMTQRVVGSPWIVALPLVAYVLALAPQLVTFFSTVAQPTFDGVQQLFGSPLGTAAVWAHLIAFDVFVGRFLYLDSRQRGISPFLMAPILLFTILLSPVGLLLYLSLRPLLTRGGGTSAPSTTDREQTLAPRAA